MNCPLSHGQPLRYDSSFEKRERHEAETTQRLMDTLRRMRETTYADEQHAIRSVHVKSHGLLKGELTVPADLSEILAQGLFAHPGTYPVVMRLSTTPGDIMPDSVSTPRGCAIKILDVPGERLPGSEGATTQDFLMVNGDPVFQVKTLKGFLYNLKPFAAATDKATGFKQAASTVLRCIEKAIETLFGVNSAKIRNMGGEPAHHILGETFFTLVPHLHGDYMAKYGLFPVSPELTALKDVPLDIEKNPTALRDAVLEHFKTQGGVWELRAQLCTDLKTMPIEDPTVEWPQEKSPYRTVARLTVAPQQSWSEERAEYVEDGMLFSPWHGLTAHRPIGAIMRARKPAYEESAQFRSHRNRCPVREPRTLQEMPN